MILKLIKKYESLFEKIKNNEVIDPSSYFEYYLFKLISENQELLKIGKVKNNFKIKDNLPISHAPPGPDIEVYCKNIAYICEGTLKSGIKQFDDEHESVSRHYDEFKSKNGEQYSQIFCFFISFTISEDIIDWFFSLYPNIKILPITTEDFIYLMCKTYNYSITDYENIIKALFILYDACGNGKEYLENISKEIKSIN